MPLGHPSWFLRGLGGEPLVVQPSWAPRDPTCEVLPVVFVRSYLEQWLRDPQVCEVLLDIYATYWGALGLTSWSAEDVNEILRTTLTLAFERGDLLVLVELRRTASRPRGTTPPTDPPVRPSSVPPRSPKTFIEIQLVDRQGKPVAGATYRVTLPDGTVRTGALDSQGLVRFDGIDPGECDIEFPNIDGREWGPSAR